MGNIIRIHSNHNDTDEWLEMSNSATSVFINTLVLSGSRLASSTRQKEIIIWLAEHDQSVVGSGTVGFDIDEMPWKKDSFDQDKEFIIKVIDNAILKCGWETLNYEPDEEIVTSCLNDFRNLIIKFEDEYIDESCYIEWYKYRDDESCGIPKGFPKCPIHEIYLHFRGCIACNDK